MSTFSFMGAKEWAKRNADILPECKACEGERIVKCLDCIKGQITCIECGHVQNCKTCNGTGNILCNNCEQEIYTQYQAQYQTDKALIERTRAALGGE